MQKSYLANNYAPLNVSFVKGSGYYLFDKNNKQYLDALSGVGVCSLGHSHPQISQTIKQQANKLLHTSNWYHIENQELRKKTTIHYPESLVELEKLLTKFLA